MLRMASEKVLFSPQNFKDTVFYLTLESTVAWKQGSRQLTRVLRALCRECNLILWEIKATIQKGKKKKTIFREQFLYKRQPHFLS